MVNTANFFDIYDLLVNEVIGSVFLFYVIGLLVILFIIIKNKMPQEMVVYFTILWSLVFVAMTSNMLVYTFVGLAVGIFFYFQLDRLFKGG